MREMLTSTEKVRFFLDQDSGMRTARRREPFLVELMELNPFWLRGFAQSVMLIAERAASLFLFLCTHRSKPGLSPARPCQKHSSSVSPTRRQPVQRCDERKANAWQAKPKKRSQRRKELIACEKSTPQELSPRCSRRSENAPKAQEELQGSAGSQAWRREHRQARGQEK